MEQLKTDIDAATRATGNEDIDQIHLDYANPCP